jgi:hypothetical protein
LLFELVADDADIVFPQLPLLRLDVGWHVGSLRGIADRPSIGDTVKPEVNFRSRINTDAAAAPDVAADVIRNPLNSGLGLNRSFSVFVNVLATNAA